MAEKNHPREWFSALPFSVAGPTVWDSRDPAREYIGGFAAYAASCGIRTCSAGLGFFEKTSILTGYYGALAHCGYFT